MIDSRDAVFRPGFGRIFCFGSNLAGRHGSGAARTALLYYGAVFGQGEGLQGSSYAIPTKDEHLQTLPLDAIAQYVARFLQFAKVNPQLYFFVTRIGCGLAGYSDEDIAPMFRVTPTNCELPPGWRQQ